MEQQSMPMAVKPRGTYSDWKDGKDVSTKVFVFQLKRRKNQSTSMRSKETGKPVEFPLTQPIPMVGSVIWKDDKTGRTYPRKIRYVPGENSIFVDEQTPDDKFPKIKVYANFIKGRFQVEGHDTPRLNFMMNWDINDSKEGRDTSKTAQFALVDGSRLAAKERDKDKAKFDLIRWCYEADWKTKIHPLASLYFSHEQMVQDPEEIRYMLKNMAERDPIWFKNMLDDKNTERKIVVKGALNSGKLTISAQHNAIFWSDNMSAPLSVAAPGKDVLEDFVTKSFSADGEKIYNAIYELMNPPKKIDAPMLVATTTQTNATEPVLVPQIKSTDETEVELLAMVRAAVEKGIITKSSNNVWFKYKENNAQKEEGMAKLLRSNPVLLEFLKKDLWG